ncbi:VWA domain-containing protein [Nocardioides sp.]|uniref:VWA domain-containing protein n=1 Tax=Nocardioides sp. TaxID=35761 RepID=UPI003D10E6DE
MSRHTPKRRKQRHSTSGRVIASGAALTLAVGTLAILALARGGARPPDTIDAAAADRHCATRPAVRVATTGDYAPVVQAVADDSCVDLTMIITQGSSGVRRLASGDVDVGIPDSRERAFLAGPLLAAWAPSTATSPVVLAASTTTAATLTDRDRPSWALVLKSGDRGPLTFGIEQPTTSGVGLALAATLAPVATRITGDRDTALATTAAALSRLPAVAEEDTTAIADGEVRIVEERLVPPGAAIVPAAEGSPVLDHPWIQGPHTRHAGAARVLLTALLGDSGTRARTAHGFREPGLRSFKPLGVTSRLLAPPAVKDIPILYALATAGGRPGNTLAVVDVSGSMNQTVPGHGQPLITYVRQSVGASLSVLSDRTRIGLWQFGSRIDGDRDHEQLVAMAPLARNRPEMMRMGTTMRARDTGTGLYDTTLAAYRHVQAHFEPAANNVVTIFTDGKNDEATGLDLTGLLAALREAQDPRRPISLLFIAYGKADRAAMSRIVRTTGGAVFPIDRPTQIIGALMTATARTVIEEQRGAPAYQQPS